MENILMAAATGEKNIIVPEQVASFVHQDIDLARLKTQLCMVPDIFSSPPEKRVQTVIKTLITEMQKADTVRRLLSEVEKLIKIYL